MEHCSTAKSTRTISGRSASRRWRWWGCMPCSFCWCRSSTAWPEGVRWLLLIVMTTHVLADPSSTILDRLLFEPATSALRLRLRQLANQTSRQPDAISALSVVRSDLEAATLVEEFDGDRLRNHLDSALKHLNNLPALTRDALVGNTPSTLHANVPPMDAAILLRNDLVQAIERLRPSTPRPTPGGSVGPGGWLHYLVLYEAYVDGRAQQADHAALLPEREHVSSRTPERRGQHGGGFARALAADERARAHTAREQRAAVLRRRRNTSFATWAAGLPVHRLARGWGVDRAAASSSFSG